jgi:hypothetical protein
MGIGSPLVNADVFISTPTGTGATASWSPVMRNITSPAAFWNSSNSNPLGNDHSISSPKGNIEGNLVASATPQPPSITVADADDFDAQFFDHYLGYNQLAIKLAGAYIAITGGSTQKYLTLYHERLGNILSMVLDDTVTDDVHCATAALEISFEALERDHEEAADLLLTCAFLHHENIYDDFICRGLARDGKLLISISSYN